MKKILLLGMLLVSGLLRAETVAEFEQRLGEAVASEEITVVHLWASWCPNCSNEHGHEGWKRFIEANPDVTVIFVSVWGSAEDDAAFLAKYGLGNQANLRIMRHPNQTRRGKDRVTELLGLPVTWMPSTWVFRDSRMRYAVNYGEIRFDMLQQMVKDSVKGQW
jgi:thiol-disulfide isomerase/thioredoxin